MDTPNFLHFDLLSGLCRGNPGSIAPSLPVRILPWVWTLYRSIRRGKMERVMGIEPTSSAWEAEVLPLNYTRIVNTAKVITDLRRRTGPLILPADFLEVMSWSIRET